MTKVLYSQAVKNFILTVVNHVGEEPGAKILAVKSGVKFNQNRDVSHLASALARTPGDTLSLGGPNGTDLSNLKNKFLSPEKENHIIRKKIANAYEGEYGTPKIDKINPSFQDNIIENKIKNLQKGESALIVGAHYSIFHMQPLGTEMVLCDATKLVTDQYRAKFLDSEYKAIQPDTYSNDGGKTTVELVCADVKDFLNQSNRKFNNVADANAGLIYGENPKEVFELYKKILAPNGVFTGSISGSLSSIAREFTIDNELIKDPSVKIIGSSIFYESESDSGEITTVYNNKKIDIFDNANKLEFIEATKIGNKGGGERYSIEYKNESAVPDKPL